MNGLELRHLRCFVAVAEERSFSRAARRLGMTQPAVSQLMKRLEDVLGHRLVDRAHGRMPGSVLPTPAGAMFLPQARQALAAVEQALEVARRSMRGEIGRLRFGLNVPSLYNRVPGLIRAFRGDFPEVEIDIESLSSGEQEEALLENRIDVAFGNFPTEDARLASRLVGEEAMQVVLPRWHACAAEEKVPLARLAEDKWIMPPRSVAPRYVDEVLRLCGDAGFTPRIGAQSANFTTALGMVLADVGIALAAESFRGLAGPDLVLLPLDGPTPLLPCYLMYRRDDPAPVIRAFLALADRLLTGPAPTPA
jgi:DNA-binding transcriptional LysR family regulator